LADLDTWNRHQLATIPSQAAGEKPVLASSHRAFISLTRAYGLQELAVLDGSSGSHVLRPEGLDASLKQLRRLGVRQLFSEAIPPSKALLRLSALSGIPIAPAALVADGLAPGQPSLPATAIANTCLISEGLGGRCDRDSAKVLQSRWQAIR
jgi:ABC-type Zn uptake system ZnuABC Zn-binding protein ZnuA